MSELRLRRATRDDAQRLWAWCNDNAVRTQAFSARPIPWGEHASWLERTLATPGCRLWIAEREGEAVGQFRADGAGTRARIDYSIASGFRGRGFAAPVLRAGAALACDELGLELVDGVVKASNVASCRAFERAGFALAAHLEERGYPCRRYEWRRDARQGA